MIEERAKQPSRLVVNPLKESREEACYYLLSRFLLSSRHHPRGLGIVFHSLLVLPFSRLHKCVMVLFEVFHHCADAVFFLKFLILSEKKKDFCCHPFHKWSAKSKKNVAAKMSVCCAKKMYLLPLETAYKATF